MLDLVPYQIGCNVQLGAMLNEFRFIAIFCLLYKQEKFRSCSYIAHIHLLMPVRLYMWTALLSPKILAWPVDGRLLYEKTKDFPANFFFISDDSTTVAALGNIAVILGGLYLLSWIQTGLTEKSESFYKDDTNLNIINNKLKRLQEKERFMEKQHQYSENESNEPGLLFGLPTLEEINPFKIISPIIQNILSFTSKPKLLKPVSNQIGIYQKRQIPKKLKKKKLFQKHNILPQLRKSDPYFLENQYTDDEFNNHYHHEEEISLYEDWRDMVALAEREALEFKFDRIIAKGINKIHTTETIPTPSFTTTTTSSTEIVTTITTSGITTSSTKIVTIITTSAITTSSTRIVTTLTTSANTTSSIKIVTTLTTSAITTSSTKIVTTITTSAITTSTFVATITSATTITSNSATIKNENMFHFDKILTSSIDNNLESEI